MAVLSMKNSYVDIENEYRPMPFWSWNDRIEAVEVRRQITEMHKQGIGGFVIHARAGLQTAYMEEEWFDSIQTAIETAAIWKMKVWIYDENGWPSGFGNGRVNGRGVEYQQKYLRLKKGEEREEHFITEVDGIQFYYDCNPFYVDNLTAKTVKTFIEEVYEKYYQRFGNSFEGFFTDEPQLSRKGIPWSNCLPEAYEKEYHENLLEHLPELFYERNDYKRTRIKFWRLITILFSESYAGQISCWCHKHGLKLTGHMLLEETLESQLTANGACMPSYYYFDIPGIDWLGGEKKDILSGAKYPLSFKQVESVAHQFEKKHILSESFAAAGQDLSFSEMRGLLEWQMCRGINLICPHLQGYSNRGMRKRDFPPAMYLQQPWWDNYKTQNDYLGRIGKYLCEGKPVFHTLVIHNISSAWAEYSPECSIGLQKYQDSMEKIMKKLDQAQILFHFGDEIIMEKYAFVENGKLTIGIQEYDCVILPKHCVLLESTQKLLKEFAMQGGQLLDEDEISEIEDNIRIDSKEILYTERVFENAILHYYVNPGKKTVLSKKIKGDYMLDAHSGKWEKFNGCKEFMENESLMTVSVQEKKENSDIFSEEWKILNCSDNALLLDYCDYYFDGKLQEKNGFVLNVLERACNEQRKMEIELHFYAEIKKIPGHIFWAGENWEKYQIRVNNKELKYIDAGKFIDESIRKIDIHDYVITGKNEICLKLTFAETEDFYSDLKKAYLFESERNKLTFPIEIEPIYLVGDFGVYTKGGYRDYGKFYSITDGDFYLDSRPEKIRLNDMEKQGFPFWAGKICVEKSLESQPEQIQIFMQGIQSIEVYKNKKRQGEIIWQGDKVNLSFSNMEVHDEQCTLGLVLCNNLRNLWGPHHFSSKAKFTVWPSCFYKESKLSGHIDEKEWTDSYILRHQTVEGKLI